MGPWDLIPDRIPVLGHLDELSYILVSLAIARLLMPPRLVHHFARQLGNARDAHGDQWVSVVAMPSAKVQSALLSRGLVLRRRIMRLRAYTESFARNAWSRWTAAIGCRDLGGFLFTLLGYRLGAFPIAFPIHHRNRWSGAQRHGAESVTLSQVVAGPDPGQWVIRIMCANWAAFGKASEAAMTDKAAQDAVAGLNAISGVVSRRVVAGVDL